MDEHREEGLGAPATIGATDVAVSEGPPAEVAPPDRSTHARPGVEPPVPPPTPRRSRATVVALAVTILVIAAGIPIAFVLGRSGDASPAANAAPPAGATSPTAPGIPVVAGFTASARSGGEVALSWSIDSGSDITGYTIMRDGKIVKMASATDDGYRDFDVRPETTYAYTIQSFADAGHSPESEAVVVATPPAPPVKAGRVAGSYVVHGKYTSENFSNYNVGDKFSSVWAFKALCAASKGACDTRTAAEGHRPGRLVRKGASYSGPVTLDDQGTCGTTLLDEYLSISFKVTQSVFSDGIWTAKRLVGNIVMDSQHVSACLSGHATMSFTATLSS